MSLSIIAMEWLNPRIEVSTRLVEGLRALDFNETLMHGLLSFMLFAGAMHVNFSAFRQRAPVIGIMATLGTLMSTFFWRPDQSH